jgi:phosphoglycolate phosphatase-like HAD superfamily hydrolase
MTDAIQKLKGLGKTKDFFVGIDSDGCAFDSMEIKHKECFIPNIINSWDLQFVSKLARETAEFINLYSEWRGINRFPGLVMLLDMLADRPEALERGYTVPPVDPLRNWIKSQTALGNPALAKAVEATHDPVLQRTLDWSKAVNTDVARIVRNLPPFPHVRECLVRLQEVADVLVVSATPQEALQREWEEHGIAPFARMICGQEMGSKKEHIQHAAGGKYPPDRILMVGDALGDLKAAKANDALFFPTNPGRESESWKRFFDEGIGRFVKGQFAGDYEAALVAEFRTYLPSTPPWTPLPRRERVG